MSEETEKELQYKICILDLLIAIDKDIIDWRDHYHLRKAIWNADEVLDLWAGSNLEKIRLTTSIKLMKYNGKQ